ncbi:MAG TPA: amino acid ABC transporter permease [Candidatus Binatia bacterium]|nr:amino acid ABC transporter permease [Candidatus Binatia bacterium]
MTLPSAPAPAVEQIGAVPATPPIVERIERSQAAARLRFRIVFALTWAILVGGLVGSLAGAGKIDPEFLALWAPYILGGVPVTIFVSVVSIALATLLALAGALGRISRSAPVFAVASLYVSLVRGTPLIVQILFVYLALPQVIPETARIPAIWLGIAALAFNYGAYMTEIFRAGIEAIPRGQIEAARALGMTERQVMQRVVLPQAIRIVIPAVGNEFIAMIKDSALVSIITVQELLWRAQRIGQSNFRSMETLLVAALVYWILTIILSVFQARLERRMAESQVRVR